MWCRHAPSTAICSGLPVHRAPARFRVTIALALLYPPAMVLRRPSGFIEPCQPSKAARPPSGPLGSRNQA